METTYDEDLEENIFLQILKSDYSDLFERATLEGWIICVPRAGSMPKYALTINDFLNHILIPSDELPETHFRTLNFKEVRICNRLVSVETGDLSVPFSVHILFEETYYTQDLLKYRILCIESPLNQPADGIKAESGIVTVNSLRDCVDLLWTESCKAVLEKMDELIQTFLIINDKLEFEPLQIQKDLVGALYTTCLQTALKDPRLQEKTNLNRHLLDNIKVSVESYIHHGIYKKLIKGITRCTAAEDANFNKTVRNLSEIQLRDLDISVEFQEVIPKARRELVKVEGYCTVVGKIGCLKRTISALSNSNGCINKNNVVAADELLPLLVFLVLKSGLPNWIAHLTYMKEFNFSSSNYHSNQYNFLVTSLEAAIEHIRGGIVIGPWEPESQIDYDVEDKLFEDDELMVFRKDSRSTSLSKLFEMAKVGDVDGLNSVLQRKETQKLGSLDGLNLCHPLCSCERCERKMSLYLCNMVPTVNSCDDRGFTILHIGAIYGQTQIIDLLLKLGADPNKSDCRGSTALHYAAARGFHNIGLLLLQAKARMDHPDNEGNIPLHFAANNGHTSCVKALLAYTEYVGIKFNINHSNNQGDIPLHNAARWGYEKIVNILLEYGASPFIENKRKLTPIDNAHNMYIYNLLSEINKKNSNNLCQKIDNEIIVAAAFKNSLDFQESDLESVSNEKCCSLGVRPNSTDEIKKVERVLRAISYGDTRLACFYLGLEPLHRSCKKQSCHPLCSCKSKLVEVDEPWGGQRVNEPLNLDICDSDGMTPLHLASSCGRTDLVTFLIEAGANPNVQTRTSKLTPLHLACQNQRVPVVEVLLETSISVSSQDSFGNTALHYACSTNNIKLVELLLKYKPNLNVRNSNMKTPLDEAKDSLSLSTINLLTKSYSKLTI